MQINESDEQFINVPHSRHESPEPVSKVTLESDRHPLKQESPTLTTDEGMQIDESDEQSSKVQRSRDES
jgi:hypothetical protein